MKRFIATMLTLIVVIGSSIPAYAVGDSENVGNCSPCAEKIRKRNFSIKQEWNEDGKALCHLAEKGDVWMSPEDYVTYIYPQAETVRSQDMGSWLSNCYQSFGKPESFANDTADNWPSGADFICLYMTGYTYADNIGFEKSSFSTWVNIADIISRLEGEFSEKQKTAQSS